MYKLLYIKTNLLLVMVGILDESVEPASFLEAQSKTQYLLDLLKPILSKIVVALIVLLIGFIVGKVIGKTLHWFLRAAELNKRWKELTGLDWRLESFLSSILSGMVYFIVIIVALNVMDLSQFLVKGVSFGIISIIFISIILGIKDFIPNYIDGIRLHKRLKVHDTVIIDEMKGAVDECTWTDIKITTEKGDILYIPNSLFLKKGFKKIKK